MDKEPNLLNSKTSSKAKKSGLPKGMNAAEAFFASLVEPSMPKQLEMLGSSLKAFKDRGVAAPTVKSCDAYNALISSIRAGAPKNLRILLDSVGWSLTHKAWMELVKESSADAKLVAEFASWELWGQDQELFEVAGKRASASKIVKLAADPVSGPSVAKAAFDSNIPHLVATSAGLASLSALAKMGFSLDVSNQFGTPAKWAAKYGNVDGLKALDALGVKRFDHAVLIGAVGGLALGSVLHLLSRGANPNPDEGSQSGALHQLVALAFDERPSDSYDKQARADAVAIAKALLAAGADPNASDARGATPLMVASWASSMEMVEALLSAGGDVSLKDRKGNDALAWVASKDQSRLDMKAFIESTVERSKMQDSVAGASPGIPPRKRI